jgi:hypothetical protein
MPWSLWLKSDKEILFEIKQIYEKNVIFESIVEYLQELKYKVV